VTPHSDHRCALKSTRCSSTTSSAVKSRREEHKGGTTPKFLLGNERTGIAASACPRSGSGGSRISLQGRIRGKPVMQDRFSRENSPRWRSSEGVRADALRVVADEGKHGKGKPNPASSVLKIKGRRSSRPPPSF